jgi:hypothetical protein
MLEARGVLCLASDIGVRLGEVRPGFPEQRDLIYAATELDRLHTVIRAAAGMGFPSWAVSPDEARSALRTAERLVAVADSMAAATPEGSHP